jgi:predicted O-methyltransferase YrrM
MDGVALRNMLFTVEQSLEGAGEWCSVEKAMALALMVVTQRPKVVCEIGVWAGASLLPMAIAAKALGTWIDPNTDRETKCRLVAIDPWSSDASVDGQIPVNANWWSKAPHEWAYTTFMERLERFGVKDIVEVVRMKSDHAPPPGNLGLLHIDGNHSDQAERDAARFVPNVRPGGIVVLDDINWDGGGPRRAADLIESMGFRPMYELGMGRVFQRQGLRG